MIPSFTKDGRSPEDLRFKNDASTPNQLTESPPAASPAISIVSDATTATEYSNGGGAFSPQTHYIYDGGKNKILSFSVKLIMFLNTSVEMEGIFVFSTNDKKLNKPLSKFLRW